jgi:hypothetical protein
MKTEGQIEMSFSLPLGNRDGGHEFPGRQSDYLRVYVEWLEEQRRSDRVSRELGLLNRGAMNNEKGSE